MVLANACYIKAKFKVFVNKIIFEGALWRPKPVKNCLLRSG